MQKMAVNSTLNIFFFHSLEYRSPKDVINFCMEMGLISDKYECPRCGCDMRLVELSSASDGFVWNCNKRGPDPHNIKRTVRKGSWFENSGMSIARILTIVSMWLANIKSEAIVEQLGTGSQTVVEWKNACREVCVNEYLNSKEQIGGEDRTVIIEGSIFKRHKYNKDKCVNGNWVFSGMEKHTDRYFIEVVEDNNPDNLLNVIQKRILPGTTVISDYWSSNKWLSKDGFKRMKLDHNLTFAKLGKEHANSIKAVHSAIKRSIPGSNFHKDGEFDGIVAEHMWRRQHNLDLNAKTCYFFEAVKKSYPPQNKDKPSEESLKDSES